MVAILLSVGIATFVAWIAVGVYGLYLFSKIEVEPEYTPTYGATHQPYGSTKTFPAYLEAKFPRSGWDCIDNSAYYNAMIGRNPTPFADYADNLKQDVLAGVRDPSWKFLASLIEIHFGEQRNLAFYDFFPANAKLYRIDERTVVPKNWRLDQDRRCKGEAKMYDEFGWVK